MVGDSFPISLLSLLSLSLSTCCHCYVAKQVSYAGCRMLLQLQDSGWYGLQSRQRSTPAARKCIFVSPPQCFCGASAVLDRRKACGQASLAAHLKYQGCYAPLHVYCTCKTLRSTGFIAGYAGCCMLFVGVKTNRTGYTAGTPEAYALYHVSAFYHQLGVPDASCECQDASEHLRQALHSTPPRRSAMTAVTTVPVH